MTNNTTKIHVKPETPPDYRISSQMKPKIKTRKKFQHRTKLKKHTAEIYADTDIIEENNTEVDGRPKAGGTTVKKQQIGKCYGE